MALIEMVFLSLCRSIEVIDDFILFGGVFSFILKISMPQPLCANASNDIANFYHPGENKRADVC